ncbi:hypothetical protein RI129_009015 [Pyrocoelia pectoralis]|uniref:Uncharacterized protein n=1 Tax=Pyrocoelia pectoralis TaxID=417401 RepID=A0AAN7ZKM2_9COLE
MGNISESNVSCMIVRGVKYQKAIAIASTGDHLLEAGAIEEIMFSEYLITVLNDSVKNVGYFYDLVESVYIILFGHSIKRWALLEKILNLKKSRITLKKLTPSRWSSRHDALEALRLRYVNVLKTLSKILLTFGNKTEIDEAKSLKSQLEKFETVVLIILETKVLKNIDTVSKLLQGRQQNIIEHASTMFNTAHVSVRMNEFSWGMGNNHRIYEEKTI